MALDEMRHAGPQPPSGAKSNRSRQPGAPGALRDAPRRIGFARRQTQHRRRTARFDKGAHALERPAGGGFVRSGIGDKQRRRQRRRIGELHPGNARRLEKSPQPPGPVDDRDRDAARRGQRFGAEHAELEGIPGALLCILPVQPCLGHAQTVQAAAIQPQLPQRRHPPADWNRRFLFQRHNAGFGCDPQAQPPLERRPFVDSRKPQRGSVRGIHVSRSGADGQAERLVRFPRAIIGLLGFAEQIHQSRAENPVAVAEGMHAIAVHARIAARRFEHPLVGLRMNLLALFAIGFEIGIQAVESRIGQRPLERKQQIAVIAIIGRQRVAFAFVAPAIGFQVGPAAVADFRDVRQQAGGDLAAAVARGGGNAHRQALFVGLAQRQKALVARFVERSARIIVHIVDPDRLRLARQVERRSAGEAARFVKNQPRGVQPPRQHRHAVLQPAQAVAHDFVENFPGNNRRMVAVAQDCLTHLGFDALAGVGSDRRPVVHALDRERTDEQHAHFVGQIIHKGRRRLAPGADAVEPAFLDKLDFAADEFLARRQRQRIRIQAFVEDRLEEKRIAIEHEIVVANGELAQAEARSKCVGDLPLLDQLDFQTIQKRIVQRPGAGAGDNEPGMEGALAGRRVEGRFELRADLGFVAPREDTGARQQMPPLQPQILHRRIGLDGARRPIGAGEQVLDAHRGRRLDFHRLPQPSGDGAAPMRHIVAPQTVDDDVLRDDRADHADNERVLALEIQQVGDLEFEAGVSAFVESGGLAVDIRLGAIIGRAEAQAHASPLPSRGDGEAPAIPGRALVVLAQRLPA
ncbi:MAG: hypothetical protein BWZ10_01559 [candidate division BRC1 bacterium ADurb.BinA364]|nr:MAG: hypothetical protein BWZ10_01559 [candidate division BRC1 bacterium ADurb.BinA364]